MYLCFLQYDNFLNFQTWINMKYIYLGPLLYLCWHGLYNKWISSRLHHLPWGDTRTVKVGWPAYQDRNTTSTDAQCSGSSPLPLFKTMLWYAEPLIEEYVLHVEQCVLWKLDESAIYDFHFGLAVLLRTWMLTFLVRCGSFNSTTAFVQWMCSSFQRNDFSHL